MKVIEMTLSNGDVWIVPAWVIADHRASYYSGIDEDTTYEDEYQFTMGSNYELTDWAANNMNWSDVSQFADFLRHGAKPDMQDEWLSAPKTVEDRPLVPEPDMAAIKEGKR